MPKSIHHEAACTYAPNRRSIALSLLFSAALLLAPSAHAQLPAGTTDTTAQPQAPPQDPLRDQAAAALDKQDYPTALKALTALAEKNPADAHVLFDLASTQDALNQTAAAEATYRRSIAADATYFDPHLALALLLARTGKLTLARAELATAITLDTPNQQLKARAYRTLARLDASTRPADASSELLAALKISPETPDDILLSGEIAESSSDLPSAEAAYRRLLVINPQNVAAIAALAHILIREQKPSEAETVLATALVENPNDPTLNAQLAGIYENQDQPDKALPIAEKLHVANPSDTNLTRLLARLYARNGQFDKADPLYIALIAANPQDPTLVTDRADGLIHIKEFAEAESILKHALENPSTYPTNDDLGLAASHLAFAASANDDPATTLQALQIRDKVLPQSPSSLFLAATANDKLHQVKLAADLYNQFLAVAGGKYPNEEWEARHRLITLKNMH